MNTRPTLKEIASMTGMSITTISRALSDPQKVKYSTRLKIESALKELQWQNQKEKSGIIGIIFPDIFSHGNISYQKDNHQATFLDFDGWQINNIPAGTSSNLPEYNEEIRSNPRFKVKGLYTKNFDRLLLLQQFLYALTKIDLFRKDNIQDQLNQIYQILNLEDNIAIQSVINTAFDFQAEDNIPKIEPIIYAIERQVNKSKKTLQKKM